MPDLGGGFGLWLNASTASRRSCNDLSLRSIALATISSSLESPSAAAALAPPAPLPPDPPTPGSDAPGPGGLGSPPRDIRPQKKNEPKKKTTWGLRVLNPDSQSQELRSSEKKKRWGALGFELGSLRSVPRALTT